MMTISWNQAKRGDVIEVSTVHGVVRGIVRDSIEPGFPIELTTPQGGLVVYRDKNPVLNVVARGQKYPAGGDFSVFG